MGFSSMHWQWVLFGQMYHLFFAVNSIQPFWPCYLTTGPLHCCNKTMPHDLSNCTYWSYQLFLTNEDSVQQLRI